MCLVPEERTMADCLTPAEIDDLLIDALPPQDKVCAEAHLAECEKCRRVVEERRADDALFGKGYALSNARHWSNMGISQVAGSLIVEGMALRLASKQNTQAAA